MERVQYITKQRARFKAMCGPVNIPWGTSVDLVGEFLQRGGAPLCAVTSKNAHEFSPGMTTETARNAAP